MKKDKNYTYRSMREEREYGLYWYSGLWHILRPVLVGLTVLVLVIGIGMTVWNKLYGSFVAPVDREDPAEYAFEISSGDSLFDKSYMSATAATHTRISTTVASTVNSENGVYNFKTFLGNVLQYYGIGLDFTIGNGSTAISVKKDPKAPLLIDTRFTDVEGFQETYDVRVLAKLAVRWKNTNTSAVTSRTFYLQEDRSITENASSATRVSGTVESVYIETGTEAEMRQEVRNQFTSNSYSHSMSMNIAKSSKIYSPEDLYVGRKVRIRSGKTGLITETIITRKTESSENEIQKITLGKLPVTLIDKIRRL